MSTGLTDMPWSEGTTEWLLTHGVRILIIVVAASIVTRIAGLISRRVERSFDDEDPTTMSEREKRAATLGKVIRNAVRIFVWGIALMMVLRELSIEIGPVLAGVGVVGLAIGFGAQSLVKDFLSGFFILLENQFAVGDVVRIAGVAGLVEKMTLRVTVLRDLEGRVHVVPNGTIEVVTNMTKEWSRVVLDVGVAYKEDVDHVMETLREVGDELRTDPKFSSLILEPLDILGVEDFADSAVVIRVRFTTQALKQWDVGREFRRRIKKAFDAKGIEIPFPHRTVYVGEAPSDARLRVEIAQSEGAAPAPVESREGPGA